MNLKATAKWRTERINKEDIPDTISFVSDITGVHVKDLHPLGSVGKTPDSGDIDLAIDTSIHDMDEIHQKMMKYVGDCGLFNKGTKVGSYAIPIAGDPSKGKVQIDIMPSSNIELSNFLYYSAGDKSKYKGAVRTILLMSVASALDEKDIDYFIYDENGNLMIRVGRTIELSKGLKRIFQYRPKKRKGDGYLKTMKTISVETFKEMFPVIEVEDISVVDDPQRIVEMLFGEGVLPNDVGSAEQVIDLICKKFPKEKQQIIFERSINKIKGAHLKVPIEMEKYDA